MKSPVIDGSAVIGNIYGFYLEEAVPSGLFAMNGDTYGIYQDGTDENYFKGYMTVGTEIPNDAVDDWACYTADADIGDVDADYFAGFRYKTPTIDNSAELDNMFGIYLEDINTGTIPGLGICYGIYQEGDERNHFGGDLDTDGDISANGDIHADGDIDTDGDLTVDSNTIKPFVGLTLGNGDNHNVDLSPGTNFLISGPTLDFAITGMDDGLDGRMITVYNPIGRNMTIKHQDEDSTEEYRIITTTGMDVATIGVGVVHFIYDGNAERWLLVGFES